MMSRDSICGRVPFRWICPLFTIMAFALLSVFPIGAAAQGAGDRPVLAPGLHELTLARAGDPGIGYAISIPPTYSPSTPAPLILALHYGIGNRDSTGVGADLVKGLIGPALEGLGAIIVAPDSVRGNWSTSENEKAVNIFLDMVMARYAIDKKRVQSRATAWEVPGPGIYPRNSRNASARRFQSQAGRRHRLSGGGYRFWRFIRATTRSYLLIRQPRELRSFKRLV
jgi:hypothetical protein